MRSKNPSGVGLGLRWELLNEVLDADEQRLTPIRFFEVSPENYMRRGGLFPRSLARIAERHSVTTHGLMMSLGSTDPFDPAYFDELKKFLERFEGQWHSDHLSFSGLDGAMLHDLLPVPFTSQSAKRIASRIREASERLERPMAVENVSYYARSGPSELTEVEFIGEVLEQADCGLLLDLNNLDVNAKNHKFDPWSWLGKIPLDRVVEIHVAGPEMWPNGLLIDTHGTPVGDSVYELLQWVIKRAGPKPVLLERDNNVPTFDELLSEIEKIDAIYQAALSVWEKNREAHRAA